MTTKLTWSVQLFARNHRITAAPVMHVMIVISAHDLIGKCDNVEDRFISAFLHVLHVGCSDLRSNAFSD